MGCNTYIYIYIYTRVPTIRLLPVRYRTGTVPYGTSKTPCRPYGNTRFGIILTRATYWYSFLYSAVRYNTVRYGIQYSTVRYGVGPFRQSLVSLPETYCKRVHEDLIQGYKVYSKYFLDVFRRQTSGFKWW